MKVLLIKSSLAALLLSACSINDNACEDVSEIARQADQCKALQGEINRLRSTNQIIRRSELERRYEQDCTELRYYRDEKQSAICNNKAAIEKELKEEKAELNDKSAKK